MPALDQNVPAPELHANVNIPGETDPFPAFLSAHELDERFQSCIRHPTSDLQHPQSTIHNPKSEILSARHLIAFDLSTGQVDQAAAQ